MFPLLYLLFWTVQTTGLTSTSSSSWPYEWPEQWEQDWNVPSETWFASSTCNVSHLKAFDMAKKGEPVWFSQSPQDNPEAPHVLPPNSTAGEQWEFDGIAEDGLASFMFGFYRDPNYAILGSGNFRCSIEMMFSNGTSYAHVDYPSESIVETCADGMRGIWRDKDEGYSYTFEVTHDMKLARIGLDSPTVKGNVLMKSRTPPRYGDATPWPSDNASTLTVPFFHWFEPIPVGDVSIDLTVLGQPFAFTGMAGHNRFWSAFSWFSCLQGLNAVRAKLGPYSLSWISFRSNVKKGFTYHSAYLVEDGVPIFSATSGDADAAGQENYIIAEKKYDGKVTGNLKDKVTGYELELVSPRDQKHWVFSIDHTALSFEYMLGRGTGGSGFACASQGGPLGLKQYKGIALTEALTFPEKSPLFKSQYKDEL